MKEQGKTYDEIVAVLGAPRTTSSAEHRFRSLKGLKGQESWTFEHDSGLKKAYQKVRSEFWARVAAELGFEGGWKVVEGKVVDVGLKTLVK
jgi:hypothetical protein